MKHPSTTASPGGFCRRSRGNAGGDPRVERATRFFDQRYAERVTVQAAARVAGLSAKHFAEVFRAAVGCTPHQYLVRCRLRRAQQLIAAEGDRQSLAEVAWSAGFCDQAHLTRHFRRAFGQSPGRWRQQTAQGLPETRPGFAENGPQLSGFCTRRMANGRARLTL